MAASDDIIKALSVIGQIPQTQADINKLAQTADMAKSPEFQAGLQAAEKQVTNFAYAHLALATVSALVGFMTFLVLLRRCKHEEVMNPGGGGRRRPAKRRSRKG